VEAILEELDLLRTPRLMVWNKCDRLQPQEIEALLRVRPGVPISARERSGLERLLESASQTLLAEADDRRLNWVRGAPISAGAS